MDIYLRVGFWYRCGVHEAGLTEEERKEVIESAQGSYLADHVGMTTEELESLDDETLIQVHYTAMVDASC